MARRMPSDGQREKGGSSKHGSVRGGPRADMLLMRSKNSVEVPRGTGWPRHCARSRADAVWTETQTQACALGRKRCASLGGVWRRMRDLAYRGAWFLGSVRGT